MQTAITDNNLAEEQNIGKNRITRQRRRAKALIVCLCAFAAISIAVAGIWGINAFAKAKKYNFAVARYEAGAYVEAKELFLSLVDYKDTPTYLTECNYQIAIDALNDKKYDEAIAAFSELGEYKVSSSLLTECNYQLAVIAFKNRKYDEAITAFSKLGEYKDSSEYLNNAVKKRKYAKFNLHVDINQEYFDVAGIKTVDEVEEIMAALLYGQWYDFEANEEITVCSEHINNRPYGVNYATCTGGTIFVNIYFLDQPGETYTMFNGDVLFEYINVGVSTLSVSPVALESGGGYTLYAIPAEEFNAYSELDAQALAQQPRYTNDQIVQKAFTYFKNKLGGQYSGAGKLYHSCSYSDANVTYDWQTKTYTCTFVGKYCTNIFDVFGTSTQTYFVAVKYHDTGADLVLIDINFM